MADKKMVNLKINNIPVSYTYKNVTKSINIQVIVRNREEPPAPTPASSSGGCGGNLMTTSVLLSSISLFGALLIVISLRKNRKNINAEKRIKNESRGDASAAFVFRFTWRIRPP